VAGIVGRDEGAADFTRAGVAGGPVGSGGGCEIGAAAGAPAFAVKGSPQEKHSSALGSVSAEQDGHSAMTRR
jgi:hypothetical protein